MLGKLYIVGTPIGNLGDISLRAIDILKEADVVLGEDTRVGERLLTHFDIKANLLRYDQHSFRNESKRLEIYNLLLQGNDLALITDAGTPGVSDPGNELINWLYEVSDEVEIIPIPGVSAVTTALSVCGFDVSQYLFVGFLPKKKVRKVFDLVKAANTPVVFFESPFRLIKTLGDLVTEFGGEGRIFVGRELTKLHEERFRGTLSEAVEHFKSKSSIKGELVCILEL